MVGYTLYDEHGDQVTHAELQLRGPWYEHGVRKELMFVQRFGEEFGVVVNPDKEHNHSAPDILEGSFLGDLKCQNTPFFSARRHGRHPQTTVTFNLKDAFAYQQYVVSGGSFPIYFWVDWVVTRMSSDYGDKCVSPMNGVWRVDFCELDKMRQSAPIHWYNERARNFESNPTLAERLAAFEPRLQSDERVYSIRSGAGGNAACSYLFDLNNFTRLI